LFFTFPNTPAGEPTHDGRAAQIGGATGGCLAREGALRGECVVGLFSFPFFSANHAGGARGETERGGAVVGRRARLGNWLVSSGEKKQKRRRRLGLNTRKTKTNLKHEKPATIDQTKHTNSTKQIIE
jgi:hypothetical protein